MAWMRQGDRLGESRSTAPAERVLVLDDVEAADSTPRTRTSRVPARARRVRQWLAVAAAAAGVWAAFAWASRPHIIGVGDRSAHAEGAPSAAASMRPVRLDAPGAWLVPEHAAPQAGTPAGAASAPDPSPARPAMIAVEVPTAARSAAAEVHRKPPIAKRRGRARH